MKIAICDDEKFYRDLIISILNKYFSDFIYEFNVDLYSSGKELCNGLEMTKYDVIFFDINPNRLNIAHEIRRKSLEAYIVLISSFMEYSLEGYRIGAVRYIMKDTMEKPIYECMDTILDRLGIATKRILIDFKEGLKYIFIDSLIYIESQGHKIFYSILETSDITKYSVYDKLDNIEIQLSENDFLRVHKSYLVNMNHIIYMKNYKIYMKSGIVLPVSKMKFKIVKEAFFTFKIKKEYEKIYKQNLAIF